MHSETISLCTRLYLLGQVLQGLRFINQYGVVHLDVKETNVIVMRRLVCKLVDFGEAYHNKVCGD